MKRMRRMKMTRRMKRMKRTKKFINPRDSSAGLLLVPLFALLPLFPPFPLRNAPSRTRT
ncbi:MAG: hypothetical protein ACT4OZ_17610 [Gemmatimonadota bacterium]